MVVMSALSSFYVSLNRLFSRVSCLKLCAMALLFFGASEFSRSQQKGQYMPGQYGLNAGVEPDPGITYATVNVGYSANQLNDQHGEPTLKKPRTTCGRSRMFSSTFPQLRYSVRSWYSWSLSLPLQMDLLPVLNPEDLWDGV